MPFADLILDNANVITMDPAQPAARGIAIRNNHILLVAGNREELKAVTGPQSRTIDCLGQTIVPGFIDAHCHLFSLMWQLVGADLRPPVVKSIGDIKEVLRKQALSTTPGRWVTGSGFNEFYLAEKRMPTRADLDEAVPDRPVVISHRSLHICVLNSKALALAGIHNETPEPQGALFERDLTTGEPNGILYEMLGHIREKVLPPLTDRDLAAGMTLVNRHLLSCGITSLHEASSVNDYPRWLMLRKIKQSGWLQTRLYMMTSFDALSQFDAAGLHFGDGDEQLRLGSIKIIVHKATGKLWPSAAELAQMTSCAHQSGFQLAVHAVDEEQVAAVITAYESIGKEGVAQRRHRIEHCSECPPHLLKRLRMIRPVVVTQPPFVHHSGDRYLATVTAERQPTLYRIRSLLDNGLVVAGSSDGPVVPSNPLHGIYAAVTRRTLAGRELLPHESVTAVQALRLYTINAAYASFEEGRKGSISTGKLADMVVLSRDPLRTPPQQLLDIRADMTIIDGKVEWER